MRLKSQLTEACNVARKQIERALNRLGTENIIDLTGNILSSLREQEKESSIEELKAKVKITNNDLATAMYDVWHIYYKNGEKCYIAALSNPLRRTVNYLVRRHYIEALGRKHIILERKGLAGVKMMESMFYDLGNVLVFNKEYKGFIKAS